MSKGILVKAAGLIALLCAFQNAAVAASAEVEDVDAGKRSKIMRARMLANMQMAKDARLDNGVGDMADCGSQNIGVINQAAMRGRMPRDLVVYAPGAINVVSGRGCR